MANAAKRIREIKVRQEDILLESRRLFQQKGVAGTTMDAIAKAVGLSKPTIYKLFPSKNDVVCSLLAQRLADLNRELDQTLNDSKLPDDPQSRLLAIGRALIAYMTCGDHAADLLFPIEANFDASELAPAVREQLRFELGRLFDKARGLIGSGERAGIFAKGWDGTRLSVFAWGALIGIAAVVKRFHPRVIEDSTKEVYAEMLRLFPSALLK